MKTVLLLIYFLCGWFNNRHPLESQALLNSLPEKEKDEHEDYHGYREHDDDEESNYDYNFRPRKKSKRSGRQFHSVKVARSLIQVLLQILFGALPSFLEIFWPFIWLFK